MLVSTTNYLPNTGFSAAYYKEESSDAIMGSSQEVNAQENPRAINDHTITELARSALSTKRKNPPSQNLDRPLRRTSSFFHEGRNLENAEASSISSHETLDDKTKELQQRQEGAVSFVKERLVARLEARKVRNSMVTTSQMHDLLQKSALEIDSAKMREISSVLARQINEVVEDLSRYRGKCLQLKGMEKSYPFYSHETGTTQMLKLGFDCWFEASIDGKHVDVFMTPAGQEPFAEGTYKQVFNAQRLTIPLRVELKSTQNLSSSMYQRLGTCIPMVLLRAKKNYGEAVEEGFKLQKKIQKLAPLAIFTSLPCLLTPSVLPPAAAEPAEYAQKWYNIDLWKAYVEGSIPLSMKDNPEILQLTSLDFLNVIIDVAKSLAEWHKAGFIHRDVKPTNIFLQTSGDEDTIAGILGDYDLTQKAGIGYTGAYTYWDALSEKGLATPFTDLYGLTMCLAEVTIPAFNAEKAVIILSEANQKACLLKTIEHFFKARIDPTLSLTEFARNIKVMLIQFIKCSEGDLKGKYKEALDKIHLVEGVITLTAKIVAANQELIESVWTNRSHTAERILSSTSDFSVKVREYCVSNDIEACFNPDMNTFAELITSKIPDWNCIPGHLKIRKTKELIRLHLDDKALDPEVQMELKKSLKKIEARENALEFMEKIAELKPEDRKNHPLYNALKKPMTLDNHETIHDCVREELNQIEGSEESKIFERCIEACYGLKTSIARRQAIKNQLHDIFNNPNETVDIQNEARETLRQIIRIENAMNFAVEIRDIYQKKVTEVIEKAPTMDMFIAELNVIKTRFAP